MEKELFLIDTDAGLDDAQAILMALAAPNVQVIGITTVSGNTSADQVSKNVLRLLKVANRLEIPVYPGTEHALINIQKEEDIGYHGKDGFGDVVDENPPDLSLLQSKHGAQAMLDVSQQYAGKITLVALGPLTNLALAIRLDPNFGKRLKSCFIMGGNYRGEGNVTPSAEFNFYTDPEAAHIVLSDLGCPITMTCWELCLDHSFPWDTYEEMRSFNTPICTWLKGLEKTTMEKCRKEGWPTYVPCDELCMAVAIDSSVMKTSFKSYSSVELHGSQTRGAMIVDRAGISKKATNTTIIADVHSGQYISWIMKTMQYIYK